MKAYLNLKDSASSFGKILFKRPPKKDADASAKEVDSKPKSSSEIDLIFNLNKEGQEIPVEPAEQSESEVVAKKKILLDDEDKDKVQYGLQEPPAKKRFIDGPTSRTTSVSAAKVLAREAKAGNKKLLSFYDEEEEEVEEYNRLTLQEKLDREEEQEESD